MIAKATENQILKWLFWGSIAITILVSSTISYDPVNVSKLVALSGVSFALYFQLFGSPVKSLWIEYRLTIIAVTSFLIAGLWTFINSDNPKPMAFFGTFGRNTGFLTYISLCGLFLGALFLKTRHSFKKVVWALIIAGWFNVIYCFTAAIGFDLIAWNNVYNRILGTFGNPNFIGAFLGIYFATAVAFIFGKETSKNQKIALLISLPFTFWEILESKAIQGLVLTAAGTALVIFFVFQEYVKKSWIKYFYSLGVLITGGFALAGALQSGPLATYVYKTSVSLRGEYWSAGIHMGLHNLLTGVGWDGYGEWYRRERRASALVLPGPETVTNASHNVLIDIFAYGGIPLLVTYLSLIILTLVAIVKVLKRSSKYDPVFLALTIAWVCYNLQALISINQIGLAIWGWILGGALIAFERSSRNISNSENNDQISIRMRNQKREASSSAVTGYLKGVSGLAIGLIISLPPFIADAQWRSAIGSKDANKVLLVSKKWPMDSFRIGNNAILFFNSKLPDQSLELARLAISYNSSSFDMWRLLYQLPNSTPAEKTQALEMMKKLDPLNTKLG